MLKIDQEKIIAQLLEDARNGHILSRDERRLCIAHLENTDIYTDKELASLFKTTKGAISKDREKIREERSALLSVLKPLDFVVDYLDNQKYVMHKLRKIIENMDTTQREVITALDKYSLTTQRTMDTLQSLGALPRELGNISITEERWVAEIASNGMVSLTQQNTDVPLLNASPVNSLPEILAEEDRDVEYVEGPKGKEGQETIEQNKDIQSCEAIQGKGQE